MAAIPHVEPHMHAPRESLSSAHFQTIVQALHAAGIAQDDIEWSENVKPPTNADDFATETIFVICNSGMKHTIAVKIFRKIVDALEAGQSASTVFGHVGKSAAIDYIWRDRDRLFAEFNAAADKLAYCHSIPWIGGITRFHLAKNFGVDCAKPDVHLQRLAALGDESVDQLCARLARDSGYRIATVDVLLWRASATGLIDSHTGQLKGPASQNV